MKTILFSLISVVLLGINGCKKKPSAGLGGNANLKISVRHHNFAIDSCIVYIKFNSSEAPSDNQYDVNQKVETDTGGNSFTTFSGLKKGDYYIFAQGWDPSISADVKGGIPYTINEETDISIVIPVTEVH